MRKLIMAIMMATPLLTAPAFAQSGAERGDAPAITAAESDVQSIDAIIDALYDVISGPAGQERNWERFKSLFTADARLGSASLNAPQGASLVSPEKYWERSHPFFLENGFYEMEIGREVDVYGNIAHVFSAYEGRRSLDDAEPFVRGINSIQLVNDGDRWWVVTVFWQPETPDNPVPDEYLFDQ